MVETFQFEKDFVKTLRCIPMAVRLKLDRCGIKLNLKEWLAFSEEERKAFLEAPCEEKGEMESYRRRLSELLLRKCGKLPQPLHVQARFSWDDAGQIPPEVSARSDSQGIQISLDQWRSLGALERFALCKLSRPSHENKNFIPALKEFGIFRIPPECSNW